MVSTEESINKNEIEGNVLFQNDDITTDNKTDEGDCKWEDLNLKSNLLKGIYSVGFDSPSYIQKKAVPHILSKKNLRAQAQSGTGKTGAFVVGTLQNIDENLAATQVLVIVSTREIAKQITKTADELSKYMNVKTICLTGGVPKSMDVQLLNENKYHIIVGTPGRVYDILKDNIVDCSTIRTLVLDEADELCKGEFLTQIYTIYGFLKAEELQVLFFSATYSPEDIKTISYIATDVVEIDLRTEEYTLQGIKQFVVPLNHNFGDLHQEETRIKLLVFKVQVLMTILKGQTFCQIMIFTKKRKYAAIVGDLLTKNEFSCSVITSDLTQDERDHVLAEFTNGTKRILVTSDLCKRGIDIQGLSVVICLDVPNLDNADVFVHRVGRVGRYGRKGTALHILTEYELGTLKSIANIFRTTLLPLPKDFKFSD